DEVKQLPKAYLDMEPIEGAIAGVRSLIGMGYEVWIATKPPTGVPHAYSDKAEWVMRHLPELRRRIIITHDKGMLGDWRDVLIDDRPHKANCERFAGTVFPFTAEAGWDGAFGVLSFFRGRPKIQRASAVGAVTPDMIRVMEARTPLDLASDNVG